MIHLKNYEKYNEELILEKIDFKSLIDRFKNTTNKESVKNLIIGSLLTFLTVVQVVDVINNRSDLTSVEKSELLSALDIKNKDAKPTSKEVSALDVKNKDAKSTSKEVVAQKGDGIYSLLTRYGYSVSNSMDEFIALNKSLLGKGNLLIVGVKYKLPTSENIKPEVKTFDFNEYKDPSTIKLSKGGWEHIREFEKLRLKAYSIGDGMITVGYGHAEPKKKSKYKVGQKISLETANKLFMKDVNVAAAGVRRMFRDWKKDGYDVKINQNQYDVLVSMAYNMGVGGLRRSKMVQKIKTNNHKDAGELIKTTSISKKFPGLAVRRKSESEKFNS